MIQYIIQIVSFQIFFLVVYDIFLKRETFFNWNRLYLLGTAVLSLVIPFIKVKSFKNVVPQEYVLSFPTVLSETQNSMVLDEVVLQGSNSSHSFSWYLNILLLVGSALALLYFIYRVSNILKLIYKNPKTRKNNINIVKLFNSSAAFSFFNYVFLGEDINAKERNTIIKHELVHVEQKHTLDLLFFELLRVVFWFNPLVYMYQNRMSDLHEFIADSKAVKHNKKQYYENLLAQVFETQSVSFINPFFKQSLIKKRIIMLQKSRSKQIQLVKYLLIVPMVLGMLVYVSCSDDSTNTKEDDINLSQYGYTVKNNANGIVEIPVDEHDKYETFLKNNQNYVAWAEISPDESEITYSVHHKDEMVPENLTKVVVNMVDGGSYDMYIDLPDTGNKDKKLIEKYNEKLKHEADSIFSESISKDIEVPFAVIEKAPYFPDANQTSNEVEKRKEFQSSINKFVAQNFDTNLAKELNLVGEQKISVFFKIGVDGKITDSKARAVNPALEAEAIRVISMLPTMIPGEQKGKKVAVPYYLPIKFYIKE
ncbi:M56 family metallopeptidase [Hanstruepera flava]|uniref:M56 family metallopeptidase n=1 Tax=Hanstruepera flava TaxID=2930218 RepID=UPI002027A7C7|nr:M56 family metallopeptidase [Hanstruepera flava]